MRPYRLMAGVVGAVALALVSCSEKKEQQTIFSPVNENATPEAVQLLDFLYSIQGDYTLTGMHNFASGMERYDSVVHSLTGKTPALPWKQKKTFFLQRKKKKSIPVRL